MASFFGFSSSKKASEPNPDLPPAEVLVIQQDRYDWYELLKGVVLPDGRGVRVVQRGWKDFTISSQNYGKLRTIVHCNVSSNKHIKDEPFKGVTTCKPDLVLVRNEVRTIHGDHRNKLIGLMFNNIPAVNSLKSIYMFCDRPVIMAELNRLNMEHGDDFPVIKQEFYDSHRSMMYSYTFPCVVKVGYAHAGAGKMKIGHHHDFEDFRSVMAMSSDYCTAEPFMKGSYDLRIQKCGDVIRAFKRISMNGSWKTNTGTSHLEAIEVTEEYRRWAELASTIFGGLDICTVDAIHNAEDGKEYILEVNGGSSGFSPEFEDEDNKIVRDLVVERLSKIFPAESSAA